MCSEGLQGTHGDELWTSICTPYTEPYVRGKRGMQRVQNGAQTVREYNHHKAASLPDSKFFFPQELARLLVYAIHHAPLKLEFARL